jgi:hypothetical protein
MQTFIAPQELHQSRCSPNEQALGSCSPLSIPITSGAIGGGSWFELDRQQISGSLQRFRTQDSTAWFPASDPYQPQAAMPIPLLVFGSGVQQWRRAEISVEDFPGFPKSVLLALPKIVASFIGKVESLTGDSANVLLINDQTGERLESQCDAEVLRENRIAAGDKFRCEVVRSKGTTTTRLSRLPPKKLSKERVEQIRFSFKDRWTF